MFETIIALGGIRQVGESLFQEALPVIAMLGAVPAGLLLLALLLGPGPAPEARQTAKRRRRQHPLGEWPARPRRLS